MFSSRRISLFSLCLLTLVAAVVVAACSSPPKPVQPATQPNGEKPAESAEATPRAEPQSPAEEQLHTSAVKVTGSEIAVVKTNKGVIRFKFYPKDAPNTVASFIELADKRFYDGLKWHRVVPGFVIQGGDPLSKTDDPAVGSGGPGWRLKAEFNSRKHLLGTVAMARSQDPDSAGSQFYICLAPQPSLDGQYTVFGQVTSGMDVVQKIQQGDLIESVVIERGK